MGLEVALCGEPQMLESSAAGMAELFEEEPSASSLGAQRDGGRGKRARDRRSDGPPEQDVPLKDLPKVGACVRPVMHPWLDAPAVQPASALQDRQCLSPVPTMEVPRSSAAHARSERGACAHTHGWTRLLCNPRAPSRTGNASARSLPWRCRAPALLMPEASVVRVLTKAAAHHGDWGRGRRCRRSKGFCGEVRTARG